MRKPNLTLVAIVMAIISLPIIKADKILDIKINYDDLLHDDTDRIIRNVVTQLSIIANEAIEQQTIVIRIVADQVFELLSEFSGNRSLQQYISQKNILIGEAIQTLNNIFHGAASDIRNLVQRAVVQLRTESTGPFERFTHNLIDARVAEFSNELVLQFILELYSRLDDAESDINYWYHVMPDVSGNIKYRAAQAARAKSAANRELQQNMQVYVRRTYANGRKFVKQLIEALSQFNNNF